MTPQRTDASAKLERWANVGERDAPAVFVGREREIDLAISQLATWQAGASRGRTVVAQGAPGAGKTALLDQIGRQLIERLPGAVAISRATPWNRRSARNVLHALAARMMGRAADEFRTTAGTESSIGARAVATARHSRSESTAPPELSCWDDLETLFSDQAGRAKPTLLLVDEIQRLGEDEETKDLLYHLHDQATFPIVLICGGLSTSAAHLRELGLSRLADGNVLRIGALTTEEAEQCLEESLRMMAEDVGIDGHPDHWARQLAPATHGWPQHVTCHIRAAAAALRASELAFDAGNLHKAAALADAAMRDYYEQRLETSATDAMVVFAVHQSISRRPLRRTEAAAVVDSVRPLLGSADGEEHDRTFRHPRDCVERMIHAGVIAYAGATTTSSLSIPIPSMAGHVAGLLSADQREDVRRTLGLPPAPP